MTDQILFVDDESTLLDGYRRLLKRHFRIETATGGDEGLHIIGRKGPFAVVVSDMRMAGMDGAEFLGHVRLRAPETVRMLLTGYSDVHAAIDAVNKGNIFRFLTKPCSRESLVDAIQLGLAQYHATVNIHALAQRAQLSDHGSWTPRESVPFDNFGNAAALPGPAQARARLAGIEKCTDYHAALLRFVATTTADSGNQNNMGEYISLAVSSLQGGLAVDDQLYRWEEHTLLVVLRRPCPTATVRTEVERLVAGTRHYVSAIRREAAAESYSIEYEILPMATICCAG